MYFQSIILILALAISVLAKDGEIDSTFGNNGVLTFDNNGNSFRVQKAIKTYDDKILIAGGGVNEILLAKLDSNGNFDNSFGVNGKKSLVLGQFNDNHYLKDVIGISGSKFLICGKYGNSTNFIARLESNGELDSTFGQNGQFTYNSSALWAGSIGVQQNGKIIFRLSHTTSSIFQRINNDGSIDSSFATNGIKSILISQKQVMITDSKVLDDDKILFCGSVNGKLMIGRILPNGVFDNSVFSIGTQTPFGYKVFSNTGEFKNIHLLKNSKYLLTGRLNSSESIIAKFNQFVQLDLGFGDSGLVEESYIESFSTNGVSFAHLDEKVILSSGDKKSWFKRFHSNGTKDYSFGDSSEAKISLGLNFDVKSIVHQKDSKLLVFGEVYQSGNPYQVGILRLKINGEIYPSQEVVNFGAVGYGQSKTKTISFVNIGTGPLYIEDFNYGNQISLEPSFLNSLPLYLATGEFVSFNATLIPNKVGPKSHSLQILGNSITNPEFYSFQVVGVGPEAIPNKTELNFQNLILNSNSSLKDSILITNSGNIDLTFNNISLNGSNEFSINFDSTSVLQPGFTKTIYLEFQSQNLGTFSTDLIVNSNASENNNLVIPINVELIALSGEEKSNEIPNEFSLSQNYPNPFNPTTIINYQLAMNSEGKLIIFNILGEKVREFSLKNSQGSITWNGTDNFERNVSSGIYFYKLETEGFSETKKMLLLK